MTTGINFSGLGSGIDFGQITDAIISDRTRPITQLQQKSLTYSNRMGSLKQLNALLINLKKAASDLTNRELGTGHSATSSDSTIVSPTASLTADNGTINLQVTRLATTLVQASRSFSAESDPILPDGTTEATFELRKGGATSGTPITINADNNSLKGLRDAINTANSGVTASIVDVTGGGDFQLVLSSKETGAAGRVELAETSSTGTLAGLSLRRPDAPTDPTDFSNLNAALTINGLAITRSKNSIDDAVTGVTLTLKKTGSATVTVTNSSDISDKLQIFLNSYNAVQDFVIAQYKADSAGRPTGVLAGDPTLRNVQQQLRSAVAGISASNGGTLQSLSDLGFGRDETDKLTLDQTKLDGKLNGSLEDVRDLLFGKTESQGGIANSLDQLLGGLSDEISGTVQTAINGYKSSIDRINKSVSDQTASINLLRDSLTRQFGAMDAAMGQLNGQSTTLTTILKSLQPSDNK
ncbi:MAG TPA: flagellar filament capping protein FliD [Pyrinomonadaceae bacterium]|nr:flagellar filament capping protein FliD [Pyrinomonadaceae bacterium]